MQDVCGDPCLTANAVMSVPPMSYKEWATPVSICVTVSDHYA